MICHSNQCIPRKQSKKRNNKPIRSSYSLFVFCVSQIYWLHLQLVIRSLCYTQVIHANRQFMTISDGVCTFFLCFFFFGCSGIYCAVCAVAPNCSSFVTWHTKTKREKKKHVKRKFLFINIMHAATCTRTCHGVCVCVWFFYVTEKSRIRNSLNQQKMVTQQSAFIHFEFIPYFFSASVLFCSASLSSSLPFDLISAFRARGERRSGEWIFRTKYAYRSIDRQWRWW